MRRKQSVSRLRRPRSVWGAIILLVGAAIAESVHAPQVGRSLGSPFKLPTTQPDPVQVKEVEPEQKLPPFPDLPAHDPGWTSPGGGPFVIPDLFGNPISDLSWVPDTQVDGPEAMMPAGDATLPTSGVNGYSPLPVPQLTAQTQPNQNGDLWIGPNGYVPEEPVVPPCRRIAEKATVPEPGSILVVSLCTAVLLGRRHLPMALGSVKPRPRGTAATRTKNSAARKQIEPPFKNYSLIS